MLRVTIELWPGGRESSKRVIATADIGRVRSGALADYKVRLEEMPLGMVGEDVIVHDYPRWSASILDMVARCIAVALSGGQRNCRNVQLRLMFRCTQAEPYGMFS